MVPGLTIRDNYMLMRSENKVDPFNQVAEE